MEDGILHAVLPEPFNCISLLNAYFWNIREKPCNRDSSWQVIPMVVFFRRSYVFMSRKIKGRHPYSSTYEIYSASYQEIS